MVECKEQPIIYVIKGPHHSDQNNHNRNQNVSQHIPVQMRKHENVIGDLCGSHVHYNHHCDINASFSTLFKTWNSLIPRQAKLVEYFKSSEGQCKMNMTLQQNIASIHNLVDTADIDAAMGAIWWSIATNWLLVYWRQQCRSLYPLGNGGLLKSYAKRSNLISMTESSFK